MIVLLKHGIVLSFKEGCEVSFKGDTTYSIYAGDRRWIATISQNQFVATFRNDEDYLYSIGQGLIRNVGASNDSSV